MSGGYRERSVVGIRVIGRNLTDVPGCRWDRAMKSNRDKLLARREDPSPCGSYGFIRCPATTPRARFMSFACERVLPTNPCLRISAAWSAPVLDAHGMEGKISGRSREQERAGLPNRHPQITRIGIFAPGAADEPSISSGNIGPDIC